MLVENLPFRVVRISNPDDLHSVTQLRHEAYARHLSQFAQSLALPEPEDHDGDNLVLLAIAKRWVRPNKGTRCDIGSSVTSDTYDGLPAGIGPPCDNRNYFSNSDFLVHEQITLKLSDCVNDDVYRHYLPVDQSGKPLSLCNGPRPVNSENTIFLMKSSKIPSESPLKSTV